MKHRHKQWLTVIGLISGLGIILLPMIGEKNIFSQQIYHILAKFPTLPQRPLLRQDNGQNSPRKDQADKAVRATVTAWVITVVPPQGQNLSQFIALLQEQGFSAFVPADSKLQNNRSVFIGPELNKDDADKISQQVNRLFNLTSDVVRYHLLAL